MLDTNVMVAALRSKTGASAAIVRAAFDGEIAPVASVALFAEYEAVLTRKKHLDAGGVTREDVVSALDALAEVIVPAEAHASRRPLLADPDDEMVLEAAINGQAAYIVTFEVSTFAAAASAFGVEVLTPGRFWAKVF